MQHAYINRMRYMRCMILDCGLGKIWEEFVGQFRVLCWHSPGGTEENHKETIVVPACTLTRYFLIVSSVWNTFSISIVVKSVIGCCWWNVFVFFLVWTVVHCMKWNDVILYLFAVLQTICYQLKLLRWKTCLEHQEMWITKIYEVEEKV